MEKGDLTQLSGINMIEPSQVVFYKNDSGYLNLKYKDTEYKKVKLTRAMPHNNPEKYISIADKEGKEIGIINDLSGFNAEQQELISKELSMLYYSPEIIKIISAKFKMGYFYLEVLTDAGKRDFAMRDPSRNIKYVDPVAKDAIQFLDIDGNRYSISSYDALDSASTKKIEAFLV